MSHFYGKMQGSRGETTRQGTAKSGVTSRLGSWNGGIHTELYVNDDGKDCYRIVQIQWEGNGIYKEIAEGVLGE